MSDDSSSSDWSAPGGGASDGYTEVSSRSWFERIKGALVGLLIGLICIPGSAWLLFWNEGRAVQTARSLSEGAGAVQSVAPDRVDPALEGRLVHVSGPLVVADGGAPLRDAEFAVQAPPGSLRLVRAVDMYQWREERRSETRSKLGGGQETVTHYSYSRTWSATPIDSGRFQQADGHRNPPMPITGRTVSVPEARLGAFRLNEAQLAHVGEARALPVDPAGVTLRRGAQVLDGGIYVGADPGAPRIGDVRVSYQAVRADAASVVAAQRGDGFGPYQTRAGDRLEMMQTGLAPAGAMIREAEVGNRVLTWVLRGVGALVMFLGFAMIMGPVVVLADVIPFLGSLVGFGTGLVGLLLTAMFAPIVIAVAWMWYRPVVAVAVLAGGAAAVFGLSRLARARRAARQPAPVAPPPAMAGAMPGGVMSQPASFGGGGGGGGRSSFFDAVPPPSQR